MSRRHASAPLPQQRSEFEANLMHADWCASQGQVAVAVGLYRTAASGAEGKQDYRTAMTAYAAVAKLEGPGSNAKVAIGRIQRSSGHRREAARTFEEVANEHLQQGRIEEGLAGFWAAAEAEPSHQRWKQLVDWCLHLGRRDDALRHLDQGSAALYAANDFAAYVPVAQLLLTLRPNHVPTLRQLVRAHLHRREVHAAVAAIKVILTERPSDPSALEHMAEAFVALRRPDKAAEVILRLAEMMLERGPAGEPEAVRLVRRGLGWRPGDSQLLLLRRKFTSDRPAAVARSIQVTEQMPPIDLSQFCVAAPPDPPPQALDEYEIIEEISVVTFAPA